MHNYVAVIALVAAFAAWPGRALAQAGHADHQTAPEAQQPASPYAGQQEREIKSLDATEVKDLLEGRGMGLAKAAELNHYPGPLHVLQVARELSLSAEQERATRALFQQMQADAIRLGRAVVEKERELDRAFAEGKIDRGRLDRLVSEIARLEGDLRVVHLAAHLTMKDLLTPEQVRRYDELRGYAASPRRAPADHGHAGHGTAPPAR
jgi:Spy/CpxP family protein refolding chaperone